MLVFDIGANVGGVTDYFVSGGHKVVAVEPLKYLSDQIEERYRSRTDTVSVVNAAVHPGPGPIDFFVAEGFDPVSTLSNDWMTKSRFGTDQKWETVLKVDCVGIDSLIETYGDPNLIKIDVEGAEYEALLTHNKKIDTIIAFEWVEELIENTKKCIDHLTKLGYTKYRNSCNHITMEDLSTVNARIFEDDLYRPIEEFNDNISSCFTGGNAAWGDVYVK